ncbi:hypothetical protein J6590_033813 [Homalodisca vitripennis]|nr:hypothetical protein J6590_033813 [Homalodisca vitripennis]
MPKEVAGVRSCARGRTVAARSLNTAVLQGREDSWSWRGRSARVHRTHTRTRTHRHDSTHHYQVIRSGSESGLRLWRRGSRTVQRSSGARANYVTILTSRTFCRLALRRGFSGWRTSAQPTPALISVDTIEGETLQIYCNSAYSTIVHRSH